MKSIKEQHDDWMNVTESAVNSIHKTDGFKAKKGEFLATKKRAEGNGK